MSEETVSSQASIWCARGSRPALVADSSGRPWLVYFAAEGGRGRVLARDVRSGEERIVSDEGIECADVCAAASGDGVVVVWSELTDGAYQLFEGDLGGAEPRRVTVHPASAIFPSLATDAEGAPCLVYQTADEDGEFNVFLRRKERNGWSEPSLVSDSPGNNWCPAVTRTADGMLVVAWDGYGRGSYDVYLRFIEPSGEMRPTMRLTDDDLFHAHVSLAPAPGGGVWVAWNRGTPDWGKDNEVYRRTRIPERRFLHVRRFLEVRRVTPERALPVFPPVQDVLDNHLPGLLHERPRLCADPSGALHCAFRFNEGELTGGHRNPKRWQPMVTSYNGQGWTEPVELDGAYGLSTGGLALLPFGGRLLAAAAGEGGERGTRDLETRCFFYDLEARASGMDFWEPPVGQPIHSVPAAPPKPPRHTITRRGEEFRLYFGDVHRHTELSFCRTCIDGPLEEAFRQTRDAAAMDFAMTADHDHQEAAPDIWAETMQAADRFYVPGCFTTFFGCEWIGGHNNTRHRNVVSAVRFPPPPADYVDGQRDVRNLWAALERGKAVTIPHHTACNMSLVWLRAPGEAADPAREPLVEIFQASRSSSEHPGCPTLCNSFYWTGQSRGFCVEGAFVSDALRQGIRMGFIASSDHMSTHRSYACLYARENTREALLEAMLARRAYAATDRIICEFTLGGAVMGEEITGGAALPCRIYFRGTGDIREVTLMRDSEPLRTWQVDGPEAELSLELEANEAKGHYFYARMIQRDTNMAWSSPIWVD